jgi:hypothetical protein
LIAFIVSASPIALPLRYLSAVSVQRDETRKTKFRHCPSLAW